MTMSSKIGRKPLVSIVVITYNSSKYILETLESTKAQLYQNIELIISDDCSTDNTLEICRKWIEENRARFIQCELLTVGKNTGIPSNCNRGIVASAGQYLKIIAGDDILLENCIALNMNCINNKKGARVLHSNAFEFYDSEFIEEKPKKLFNSCFFNIKINAKQQFNYLIFDWPINASTLFFEKSIFEEFGLYNEDLKVEDWSYLLNLTSKKIKIDYLDAYTTKYRIHKMSITRIDSDNKLVNSFYLHQEEVFEKQLIKYLNWHEVLYFRYKFFRFDLIMNKTSNNENNLLLKIFYILLKTPDTFYGVLRKLLICFELFSLNIKQKR